MTQCSSELKGILWSLDFTFVSSRTSDRKLKLIRICMRNSNVIRLQCTSVLGDFHACTVIGINLKRESRILSNIPCLKRVSTVKSLNIDEMVQIYHQGFTSLKRQKGFITPKIFNLRVFFSPPNFSIVGFQFYPQQETQLHDKAVQCMYISCVCVLSYQVN